MYLMWLNLLLLLLLPHQEPIYRTPARNINVIMAHMHIRTQFCSVTHATLWFTVLGLDAHINIWIAARRHINTQTQTHACLQIRVSAHIRRRQSSSSLPGRGRPMQRHEICILNSYLHKMLGLCVLCVVSVCGLCNRYPLSACVGQTHKAKAPEMLMTSSTPATTSATMAIIGATKSKILHYAAPTLCRQFVGVERKCRHHTSELIRASDKHRMHIAHVWRAHDRQCRRRSMREKERVLVALSMDCGL